jgi:hypothetical protein
MLFNSPKFNISKERHGISLTITPVKSKLKKKTDHMLQHTMAQNIHYHPKGRKGSVLVRVSIPAQTS